MLRGERQVENEIGLLSTEKRSAKSEILFQRYGKCEGMATLRAAPRPFL